MFEVRLRSKRVQRELDSLQETEHQRVADKLRALSDDPRPKGYEKLLDDVSFHGSIRRFVSRTWE